MDSSAEVSPQKESKRSRKAESKTEYGRPRTESQGESADGSYGVSTRQDEDDSHWHPGDMTISLEAEFYTAAFVSPLHLHQQRHGYQRICGESFFVLGMLAVACMQCLTVFGMSTYLVEKDGGYMDEFKLGTGLFTTGGSTLSGAFSQDLCGSFSHIGLKKIAGVDHLSMPDGTRFAGTADMPIYHSYKMPSGSWIFHSIGRDLSFIDKELHVVHDATTPWKDGWARTLSYMGDFRVDYGVLFVIMVGWLWYHVLFEIRKTMKFAWVLRHFHSKGIVEDGKDTTELDSNTGSITVTHLTWNAFSVGVMCCVMRFLVVVMMLYWGTLLLAASWNKLSLVLNSLAIGIVFELDSIIAYAVIDHNTMQRIESLEPIRTRTPKGMRTSHYGLDIFCSILMLVGTFVCAMLVRKWQVDSHVHQLHNAAALCLFAGPTPHAQPDLLAPVPGFCESLLSMTCASNVTGPGSKHGPCLITDQNIFQDKTVMLYGDEPLFENMYDKHGKRRSMAKWGEPIPQLVKSKTWETDQHLSLFRRVCAQLYHPGSSLDSRVVDPNLSSKMESAPFYCKKDDLFKAVFGGVKADFDGWSNSLDLNSDRIVAALDRCHEPITSKPSATAAADSPAAAAPADAAAGAKAPAAAPPGVMPPKAPASTHFLRVARHRQHPQIYQQQMSP